MLFRSSATSHPATQSATPMILPLISPNRVLLFEDIPLEVQDQEEDSGKRIDAPGGAILRKGLAYRLKLPQPFVVLLHIRQEAPDLRDGVDPGGTKDDVEVVEAALEIIGGQHDKIKQISKMRNRMFDKNPSRECSSLDRKSVV